MTAFGTVARRDLLANVRRLGDTATPLLFFVTVTALVPLGLDPKPELVRTVAPGVIWTGALLASLIGLERLFAADHDDGLLEQLVLAPQPLSLLVLGKVAAHWLVTGLPLVVAAPLVAELLALPHTAWPALIGGLLLGTPVLALLGALGAALTVAARRSSLLVPVIILPLCVPVLVFGARAVDAAAGGDSPAGALYLLAALGALSLSLVPAAIAAALRINLE